MFHIFGDLLVTIQIRELWIDWNLFTYAVIS